MAGEEVGAVGEFIALVGRTYKRSVVRRILYAQPGAPHVTNPEPNFPYGVLGCALNTPYALQ